MIWRYPRRYTRATVEGLAKAIACADPARQAARWYKYKLGITTPSQEVVQAVDKWRRGSALAFNHPLWHLAERPSLPPWELRSHVLRLGEFAGLIADLQALTTTSSPFWRLPKLDHRKAISSILDACTKKRAGLFEYLNQTAALVALIHDAEHAQRQVQHFEAHIGLVQHLELARQKQLIDGAWVGKIEALLVARWLLTEYRLPKLQVVMRHLASIDHSNVHRSGAAKELSAAAQQKLKSLRGQWVIEEIARRPPRLALLPDD